METNDLIIAISGNPQVWSLCCRDADLMRQKQMKAQNKDQAAAS